MKLSKWLLVAMVLVVSLSLMGCVEKDPVKEILKLSLSGEKNDKANFLDVTFEDGSQFYFGSSPIDHSVGAIWDGAGAAILFDENRKPVGAQVVRLGPFGVMGMSCTVEEATKILEEILKNYKEKLKTVKIKVSPPPVKI